MDEIVREFLVESHEHLDAMETDLVALEADPDDEEALARVFRAVHTIKGSCGFFGLARVERLAHAGEHVLTRLLGGELRFDAAVADPLLRLVDALRALLATIERSGEEGDADVEALAADLERLAAEGPAAAPGGAGAAPGASAPAPVSRDAPPPAGAGVAARTVRLDVALLDELMDLVGELVLVRHQIADGRGEAALRAGAQQLHRVTGELQDRVMQARMEPVRRVWGKYPRLVRDLAALFGKRVRLEMRGAETELDRTILEAIADPLTHLVRNALDHGIERPAVRRAAAKPEEGRLTLSALQQGGHVVIEVRDDGAGIDPARVRARARERGVRDAAALAGMSDADALQLVFEPGLSTAEQVTSVSGRGVGMDVVRTNVERVGGSVELRSAPGTGTTCRILLPLTLAILPGVLVESGGRAFVIPRAYLRELVLLHDRDRRLRVTTVHDAPVCHLRGRLLPLLFLDEELGLAPRGAERVGAFSFAVVDLEGRRFGLVVDRILDTFETVVKPLGRPLDRIAAYAGATILGDGSIALILDPLALAARGGLLGEASALPPWGEEEPAPEEPKENLLLFQGPDDARALLPLDRITRLEEFPSGRLERIGDKEVVQYGGRILPLVRVGALLAERRRQPRHPEARGTESERGAVQVAVYRRGAHAVGLVVDRILDVVALAPDVQRPGSRPGVKGTLVVEGRVAELLDADHFLRLGDPGFDG